MNQAFLVPVVVITGFLGAGKTTLLNELLRRTDGQRIGVIVNDFGSLSLDAQLVNTLEGEKISLPNGCVCCSMRSDLEEAVLNLLKHPEPFDAIVVEASGLADPGPIGNTVCLSESLRAKTRLDSIVAVLDCAAFPQLKGPLAFLARRQIGSADLVLLNKVDLVNPQELELTRSKIRDYVKSVRIVESVKGQVPLELILGISRFCKEQLASGEPVEVDVQSPRARSIMSLAVVDNSSLSLEGWSFDETGAFEARALKRLLRELPPGVLRVKGLVQLVDEPGKCWQIEMCGTRVDIREAYQPGPQKLLFLAEVGGLQVPSIEAGLRRGQVSETEGAPSVSGFWGQVRRKFLGASQN